MSTTPQHRRARFIDTFGVLSMVVGLLMSLLAVVATPQAAFADGAGSSEDCEAMAESVAGDTATAPEGKIISEICFKAGQIHSEVITADGTQSGTYEKNQNSPNERYEYVVSGIGTGSVTVGQIEGPGLSHVDYVLTDAPPTPQPTGTLACQEIEPGQFSISYTLDKDGSTDPFDLTGPSGATDLAEAGSPTVVAADAAEGDYAITGTDATLTVDGDCTTLPPPPPQCEVFDAAPPGGGYYRTGEHVVIDTDTSAFAGSVVRILDDNVPEPSEHPDNRMRVEVDGVEPFEPFAYEIGDGVPSPEFVVGDRLVVTLLVANITSIDSLSLCIVRPPAQEPTASVSGECASATVTITNPDQVEFEVVVSITGRADETITETTQYTLVEGETLTIDHETEADSFTWEDCSPPAPDPDIDLVKSPVIGGDSDLSDGDGGAPFLSWSEEVTDDQTAVYSYVITNTGEEALTDLELTDDRIGDIDVSSCADPLPVDDTCTVTASETFSSEQAAALITNTAEVTATGDRTGASVSADDAATIELVIVNAVAIEGIEIDLVKEVVLGAGDVDEGGVVTWSSDDFEAGESKTVVYRFTVTNIGEATIVDVELTDPMLSADPIIAVADGVTLEPGESTVVDVEYSLTADQAFPDGEPTASKIVNVAEVSGANVTQDAFSDDSDDATVTTQVVFDEVLELPKTGLDSLVLLPLGVLMVALGCGVLLLDRRRTTVR